MSLHELKPCPFCGGQVDKHIDDYGEGKFYVTVCCSKCGAKVFHKGAIETATEKAVDAWNRRADDGKGNQAAPDDLKRLLSLLFMPFASDPHSREISINAQINGKSVNITYDPHDPEAVKAADVWRKALFAEPSESAEPDCKPPRKEVVRYAAQVRMEKLRQAAEPLREYLKAHGDPHTSVIVTQYSATEMQDEQRVTFDHNPSASPAL